MRIFGIGAYAQTNNFTMMQSKDKINTSFGQRDADFPPSTVKLVRGQSGVKIYLSGLVKHGPMFDVPRSPSHDEEIDLIQNALASSFINKKMANALIEEANTGKIMLGRKLTSIKKEYGNSEYTLHYACCHGNIANTAKIDVKGRISPLSFARGLF